MAQAAAAPAARSAAEFSTIPSHSITRSTCRISSSSPCVRPRWIRINSAMVDSAILRPERSTRACTTRSPLTPTRITIRSIPIRDNRARSDRPGRIGIASDPSNPMGRARHSTTVEQPNYFPGLRQGQGTKRERLHAAEQPHDRAATTPAATAGGGMGGGMGGGWVAWAVWVGAWAVWVA